MTTRNAAFTLLLGNFVIGLSIMGPAGMIDPLAVDFGIAVASAAFLITGGAIVLSVGSPLVAWGASSIDKRILLSSTMAVIAVCHVASALAPSYGTLLAVRLVEMAFAAVFTPQAAGAIAMLVPERERSGAISFVFLGWSLSAAVGMPLVAWISAEFGWRYTYWALAVLAAIAALAVASTLPRNLRGVAMSLVSWGQLLKSPFVLILLAVTIVSATGQFIVFTFFGPLLTRVFHAGPTEIATCFAVFGIAGFVGNVVATRVVGHLGVYKTSIVFFGLLFAGFLTWAMSGGSVVLALVASAIWGLGFASSNSMQQARLAAHAPAMTGGAIALNSSSIYVGQAMGSAIGGAMFDRSLFVAMGWTGVALLAVTLWLVFMSGRLRRA